MRNAKRPILALACGTALALGAAAILTTPRGASAETMALMPAPAVDEPASGATSETAVFAGGCFWGVQGVFQHVKGVTGAVSGYSGGAKATATYPQVSEGSTGHAESVKVTFDPKQVSYGQLLQVYFSVVADPTTLNRQGPDEGTQYRTDLFATSPEQTNVAKSYIAQLTKARVFPAPIVTKVSTFEAFYPAEAYHQNYLTEHPHNPYIAFNDIPKVEGLRKLFPTLYRSTPALVVATD